MTYDPTVILDRKINESASQEARNRGRGGELSGRLTADGVEFGWEARPIHGLWFVTVNHPTRGSRSQMTQDDPINFALQLAKQVAASRGETA